MGAFTLIDDGRQVEVRADTSGTAVRLSPAVVEQALGWVVTPRGLCRGDACVPWPPGSRTAEAGGLDLAGLAACLGRPLALDLDERVAYLGAAAAERSAALASIEAPDFTLPDLEGRPHTLSQHRGLKVLLVAYASW